MVSPQRVKVVSISKSPNKTSLAAPTPSSIRDSYAVTAIADITDRSLHAAAARLTPGFRRLLWLKPIWIG